MNMPALVILAMMLLCHAVQAYLVEPCWYAQHRRGCMVLDGKDVPFNIEIPDVYHPDNGQHGADCISRYRDVTPAVEVLQVTLNNCYRTGIEDKLKVDGRFGSKTEAAMKRLQKSLGLPETGEYNAGMMAHMTWSGARLDTMEITCFKFKHLLGGCDLHEGRKAALRPYRIQDFHF